MNSVDVLILGAGASGLWCAKTAASQGLSVCLVDHAAKPGKKLRIAGGGKGNVTNLHVSPADYVCANSHFCKSALARFSPWDMVEYLATHSLGWEERDHGQIFCTHSADELVHALETDCAAQGVTWRLRHAVQEVTHAEGLYTVRTDKDVLHAPAVVVALGGPAWPQVGATDMGHRLAKRFGHRVIAPRPALVPLAMPAQWVLAGLSGIAVPATISCGGKQFTENILVTHTGISGPATLHASCHWQPGEPLEINFLPSTHVETLLREAGGKPLVRTALSRMLPDRLVAALLGAAPSSDAAQHTARHIVGGAEEQAHGQPIRKERNRPAPAGLGERQIAQLSTPERELLTRQVHHVVVTPTRTEGMRRAEVTGGGVATDHVSSKTMESTRHPGLYFIGEVLDVTGQLGGFNLHWAWASAQAAGIALASGSRAEKPSV